MVGYFPRCLQNSNSKVDCIKKNFDQKTSPQKYFLLPFFFVIFQMGAK